MLYPLSYRPVASSPHVAERMVRSAAGNLAAPTVDKSGPVGKRDRTSDPADRNREEREYSRIGDFTGGNRENRVVPTNVCFGFLQKVTKTEPFYLNPFYRSSQRTQSL